VPSVRESPGIPRGIWSRCGPAMAAMAAIKKAYEDAGRQMPEDLNPTNLR
jgi:hypothetical protein